MKLKKATRTRSKARIGLFGASGSGKTMSALKLAHGMIGDWSKIAVIDTEHGSADLYSHLGDYNTLTLEAPFSPERYIEAIRECEKAGMEVIIIDSISHEWMGKGGCLELVEKVQVKFDMAKWAAITPRHNNFIDSILQAKAHVICCGRSKSDYDIQDNEKGKKTPVKIGLKAVTREGFDFEMTLCFDIDAAHQAKATKDRTGLFDDVPPFVIDETTGKKLIDWLMEAPEPEPEPATMTELVHLVNSRGLDQDGFKQLTGFESLRSLPPDQYENVKSLLLVS